MCFVLVHAKVKKKKVQQQKLLSPTENTAPESLVSSPAFNSVAWLLHHTTRLHDICLAVSLAGKKLI